MKDGNLYNERERMVFIAAIAAQYHELMDKKLTYMEGEIETIASWKDQK